MNGLELLRRCAELFPRTIRVLATAHAHTLEVQRALAKGTFSGLVEKPWTRAIMLDAITTALADPTR
jgi:CheY-like chemotaxis protein